MSTNFIAGEGVGGGDSAVSIVTKLRAGRSGVRIPAVTRDISLLQNAHPAVSAVGIGVFFSGGKAAWWHISISHMHSAMGGGAMPQNQSRNVQ